MHDEKVTVWFEFTISTVIGPIFFEEIPDPVCETVSMTGERCTNMLQNHIIPSLDDNHLLRFKQTFMQDGAPPHIARQVKDLLHRSFGDDRVLSLPFRYA